MHAIQRRLLLFAFVCFLSTASSPADEPTELVTAINNLGFDILAQRLKANPNQNTLLSPASLGISLALLTQGASAETAAEFSRLFGATTLTKQQIATQASDLKQSLIQATEKSPLPPAAGRGPQNLELEIADSLWIDDSSIVKPAFLDIAHNSFRSEVHPQDFNNPQTCNLIKQWVTKKTRGRITDAPCPGDSSGQSVVLINAVYFRDNWLHKFPASQTKTDIFHSPTRRQKVPFMRLKAVQKYAAGFGRQHVILPYQNPRFCIDLILPDKTLDLADCAGRPDLYSKFINASHSQLLNLKLPKVEIEDSRSLLNELSQKGLSAPFTLGGLSEITEQAKLSDINQKTSIDINEKGTEAAAVTAVYLVTAGSGPSLPEKPINVTFDRPFLFAVRDQQTGAILFLGTASTIPKAD